MKWRSRIRRPVGALALGVAVGLLAGMLKADANGQHAASDDQAVIARGRYLVHDVAQCVQCHTPRDHQGNLRPGRLLQGATIPLRSPYPERPWAFQSAWIAGLTNWEPDDVSYLLQHGHRPDGYRPRPPMPTFRMTKTDADAVVAYLTSLADAQAGSTVD